MIMPRFVGPELLDLAEVHGMIVRGGSFSPRFIARPSGCLFGKARTRYEDEDMLAAIANHTLGALEMSPLEEIIFLADMIEPGRDYPTMEGLNA